MISFTFRSKFAPEDRAEAAATAVLLAQESRREPGCVTYIPHQVQDEPDTIVFYEQYRDEQALEAHRHSAHFQKYSRGGVLSRAIEQHVENLTALV